MYKHPYMYSYPHTCTCSSISLCRGVWKRSVTTSLLSTSVCSLPDDVPLDSRGVRSALRARLNVRWRCQLCLGRMSLWGWAPSPHTLMWLSTFSGLGWTPQLFLLPAGKLSTLPVSRACSFLSLWLHTVYSESWEDLHQSAYLTSIPSG